LGVSAIFFLFLGDPVRFEFVLETNQILPAESALAVSAALVRAIRASPNFTKGGQVEIVEAGRGSFKVVLSIFGVLGGLASAGRLGLDIADRLMQADTELAKCVAWTMVEDGVTKAGIECGGTLEVLREEMPAVKRILEGRVEHSRNATAGEHFAEQDLTDLANGLYFDETGQSSREWPDHSDFLNIPAEPEDVQLPGRFHERDGQMYFVQPNGQIGLLEEDANLPDLPMDVPLLARLTSRRGPRGGWVDRRVHLIDWTPANGEE